MMDNATIVLIADFFGIDSSYLHHLVKNGFTCDCTSNEPCEDWDLESKINKAEEDIIRWRGQLHNKSAKTKG